MNTKTNKTNPNIPKIKKVGYLSLALGVIGLILLLINLLAYNLSNPILDYAALPFVLSSFLIFFIYTSCTCIYMKRTNLQRSFFAIQWLYAMFGISGIITRLTITYGIHSPHANVFVAIIVAVTYSLGLITGYHYWNKWV